MPLRAVGHVAHAVALDRVCDYHDRLVLYLRRLVQRVHQLLDSVAVYFEHLPVERLPLVLCRVKGHDVLGKAVLLDAVAVKYSYQVVQLEFRSRHGRLPYLAFVRFAVAYQDVNAIFPAVQPARKGDADPDREPNALRAARILYARDAV